MSSNPYFRVSVKSVLQHASRQALLFLPPTDRTRKWNSKSTTMVKMMKRCRWRAPQLFFVVNISLGRKYLHNIPRNGLNIGPKRFRIVIDGNRKRPITTSRQHSILLNLLFFFISKIIVSINEIPWIETTIDAKLFHTESMRNDNNAIFVPRTTFCTNPTPPSCQTYSK